MVERNMTTVKNARGLMQRLRSDTRGTTLAMIAAALIPIAAMIGGGVDMSRAYMAKSRLQSACDAASLAGRRIMRNNALTADVQTETLRFFNFNFEQGKYETAAFTPVVSQPTPGVLRVTARTTIPTTIMSLFGFERLPLAVSCDASLNFVNTDIVLVLDVTGSMNDPVGGVSKISALRDAVMALYDELAPVQAQLEANGQRLRFGIVPYSSTVNVGNLIYDVDPDYMTASADYQSREANYSTPVYVETGSSETARVSQTYSNTLNSNNCNSYGANRNYPTIDGAGPFPVSGSQASGSVVTRRYVFRDWGQTGTTSGNRRTCRRWQIDTTTTYQTRYSFTNWEYHQTSFDTAQLLTGNPVELSSNTGGTVATAGLYNEERLATEAQGIGKTTTSWNGCIEERRTVNNIRASSGYTIPTNAFDLDINLVPTADPDTQWRPQWPRIAWRRESDGDNVTFNSAASGGLSAEWSACPREAQRLQAWSRTGMQNYVNSIVPVGGTYHDIGMLWGARFISPSGVFSDSPDIFNGMPVSRHIIYMTDGALAPNPDSYSAYGIEMNDRRVTGSATANGQYESHLQRFRMTCSATKNMNVSIWVIAFATTLTTDMTNCATNSDQASLSSNRDQLIARFRQIGNQIGALRLTE